MVLTSTKIKQIKSTCCLFWISEKHWQISNQMILKKWRIQVVLDDNKLFVLIYAFTCVVSLNILCCPHPGMSAWLFFHELVWGKGNTAPATAPWQLLGLFLIKIEGVAVWWLDWHYQVCGQPIVVVLPKRELCSVLCTSVILVDGDIWILAELLCSAIQKKKGKGQKKTVLMRNVYILYDFSG